MTRSVTRRRSGTGDSRHAPGGILDKLRRRQRTPACWLVFAGLALCACGGDTPTRPATRDVCGSYPAPQDSPYVLPFPVGESSRVFQANCGPYTHSGAIRYSTDFARDVGQAITAARAGSVTAVSVHLRDNIDIGTSLAGGNYIQIVHDDGTLATYNHVMQDGSLVAVGDVVAQGQQIGFNGNTGYTGPTPHLHIQVAACRYGCETIPITFRNADPAAPQGLVWGRTYTALPY